MKRFTVFLCVLTVLLLLVACSENPGTTTMRLELSTESCEGSRTLLPSDSTLLDVTRYTVSGTGPNGKTFTRSADSSSVEIEGLTIGEWTVTAKGLNREGTELVSGTKTFRLTSTATPQTIILDTLIGTGSFSFSLDWSLCDVASPAMEVYLTGPDMKSDEVPLDVTLNTQTKTATLSETLSAGSYKVRVLLKDGSQLVAGLVEAIRISNGTSTTGSHTFHFNELGPTTLMYFADATGTPIRGTLSASGNPETFLDGLQYSFAFSFTEPGNVSTEGLSLDWYYDGNLERSDTSLTSSGSTLTKVVGHGVHRIDAVVYNKLLGSTGSAAYTFTVVPNGSTGEMALLNADAANALDSIDSNTIISPLPGGKFLVTSPDSAKMYICGISSNALQVLKTYNASNFGWIGSIKHVFSDDEMPYVIITDNYSGTENFTALKFNAGANTLEEISGMRFQGRIPSYGIPFTNFTAAAFNATAGFVTLSDAGSYGYDYVLKVANGTLATAGTVRKKNSTYYNVSDMDYSPNGLYHVSTGLASAKFISSSVTDLGSLSQLTESEASSSPMSMIRYVNNQTVIGANSLGLTSYKVVPGSAYTKYKTIGMSVKDLEADGENYFYVADNSRRIVSFSASGFEVTQLGATELEASIRSICLSGGYLAVLTSQNDIALFQAIE